MRTAGWPFFGQFVAHDITADRSALKVGSGVDPSQLPSPWTAAYSSFISFSLGAFLPLLPYVCGASSLLASIIVSAIALFTAGAISSRFTARGWLFAGTRQLILGAIAAAVTFGIGALFQVSTG